MTYIIGIVVVLIILYQIGKFQQMGESNKSVSNLSLKLEDDSKWEIVHRKTERWTELGFGDGDNFPGYGRVYEREFKVWYCDVGSKEVKGEQIIKDRHTLGYYPENAIKITGDDVYLDELYNTKGYECVYTQD